MNIKNHVVFVVWNRWGMVLLILVVSLVLAPTPIAYAGVITVNSTADAIANDSVCTLREAINNANDDNDGQTTSGECTAGNPTGADTISLLAGTYTLTISGENENLNATGDLDINSTITINGASDSSSDTIIQAGTTENNGIDRVFHVHSNGNLTLNTVTIQHGRTGNTINGGAGIFNEISTLTINDSTITKNNITGPGPGGGITTNGFTTIRRSTISNNSAYNGGGIFALASSTADLVNVTISGNSALIRGGGIFASNAAFHLNHVTLVHNNASFDNGGGIEIANGGGTSTVNIRNSIIANNDQSPGYLNCHIEVGSSLISGGYNLGSDNTCNLMHTTDMQETPAEMGLLADNGGPTFTHSLLSSNAAIDAIPTGANGCGTTYTIDQRGIFRPADGDGDLTPKCDIGSYESGGKLWDGEDGDGLWSTAENWFPDGVPGPGDQVILNNEAATNITIDTPATIAFLNISGPGVTLSQTGNNILTVTGDLIHSGGILQHKRTVNNNSLEFLRIVDGSGSDQYRGAQISSTNNLGLVTVSIQAVDQINTFCTEASSSFPAYANRCFEITAVNNGLPATIRLYTLLSDLNPTINTPRVYGFEDPDWIVLDGPSTGFTGDYLYAQGITPGLGQTSTSYAEYLIAQDNKEPTTIQLLDFAAQTKQHKGQVIFVFALVAGAVGASLLKQRHKKA